MPLSPSGVYTLPDGYLAVTGQDILPSQHNPPLQDIAAVLSEAFYRTGVAPMLANLNMNTFKAIGLADGTNDSDAVNKGQLDALVTGAFAGGAQQITFDNLNIMLEIGSSVVTTTGVGGGTITFPTAFSSTPIGVIAVNGNATTYTGTVTVFPVTNGTSFTFRTEPPLISSPVRVNWLAIGSKT